MAYQHSQQRDPGVRYSQSKPQPRKKRERVPGESRFIMKDGPDGWDRWIAWNHRRKLKGSGVNVALIKHQTNRQALGAAPAKKQKLGVQRSVRRKEIHDELEGHVFNQQRASEESGLGDSAKDIQTKAQKAFLQKEDSTQLFATLRRLQTEQDDSDWTDIGSTADEDEYAIV